MRNAIKRANVLHAGMSSEEKFLAYTSILGLVIMTLASALDSKAMDWWIAFVAAFIAFLLAILSILPTSRKIDDEKLALEQDRLLELLEHEILALQAANNAKKFISIKCGITHSLNTRAGIVDSNVLSYVLTTGTFSASFEKWLVQLVHQVMESRSLRSELFSLLSSASTDHLEDAVKRKNASQDELEKMLDAGTEEIQNERRARLLYGTRSESVV